MVHLLVFIVFYIKPDEFNWPVGLVMENNNNNKTLEILDMLHSSLGFPRSHFENQA